MRTQEFNSVSVYVGTYNKYSKGSISGEWLDLRDFASWDDFQAKAKEIHQDEDRPEFMHQDYEGIPESLIKEFHLNPEIFEILQDIDASEWGAFKVWADYDPHTLKNKTAGEIVKAFRSEYIGEYDSLEAFGWEKLENDNRIPEDLINYIDIEAYTRDLFLDSYRHIDGYVFSY